MDVLTRRMKLAWFQDLGGTKLAVTRGDRVLVQEARYGVQTTAVSSTLTISGMRAEDAGSWHCFRCTGDCSYFVFIRDQPLQVNHTLHAAGGWGGCSLGTNTVFSSHQLGCRGRPG